MTYQGVLWICVDPSSSTAIQVLLKNLVQRAESFTEADVFLEMSGVGDGYPLVKKTWQWKTHKNYLYSRCCFP